jgi:hypothetical protein
MTSRFQFCFNFACNSYLRRYNEGGAGDAADSNLNASDITSAAAAAGGALVRLLLASAAPVRAAATALLQDLVGGRRRTGAVVAVRAPVALLSAMLSQLPTLCQAHSVGAWQILLAMLSNATLCPRFLRYMASYDVASNICQVHRGLFMDASIELPLGV